MDALTQIPPVTGGSLESDVQRKFAADMHVAGFIVNWMTFIDGTRAPTVYGSNVMIRQATQLPLNFRKFGDNTVAWPVES